MALRLVLLMVLTLVDLTHSSNSSRSAVVQCPAGEPISNSIDTTITGTLGANFTFDCKPGFSKFGPTGNMTCGTDGQWNIDTACEEVQCPAGDPITNSTDTTIVGTLGENFTFDCRPGFIPQN
ncbi:hypothetical protein LOTGIDRAFT_159943 [Lottia gigantea]|uniref:Sushi domain-containing protein n=1 Tax=Lottia gigantea TaxID=225164 RepID=V4AHZ2_LOTGI|nr:hypothetical protein LOTGIDRAFT_159943 [Lottia gigantea]ESO96527.1 hypothetical protein LOTGIDRAFT_159943 [Lottia gigantea]